MPFYYAVSAGRSTGIFHSWNECKKQVNGFSGARFKKFQTESEAIEFFNVKKDCSSLRSNRFQPYARKSHTSQASSNISVPSSSDDIISIYTDGCCLCNGKKNAQGGIGVYWGEKHSLNLSEKLNGRQTNNRAEIEACCRGIEQAQSQGIDKIRILTDSSLVVNAMTSWLPKWKVNNWRLSSGNEEVKNKEDFMRLDNLCQQMKFVEFQYVTAHVGIIGNEGADSLAKAGALLT